MGVYDIRRRFTVDDTLPPPRIALRAALEHVRAVVVQAATVEEAESHADQVRVALEQHADRQRVRPAFAGLGAARLRGPAPRAV